MQDYMTNEKLEAQLADLGLEPEAELEWLKDRLDDLNIAWHHRNGREKLIDLLTNGMNGRNVSEESNKDEAEYSTDNNQVELEFKSLDRYPDEDENAYRNRKRKEASKLVRIRLTNMNPMKKEWDGEIMTVGNDLFTFKRFIPFKGVETHVEVAFMDMIRDRKYQEFRVKAKSKLSDAPQQEGYLVPEFALEILPPLTKQELEQLARQQARRGS